MLGVSPVAGRLYDGYGPRLPIMIGCFFHVFGLMMTSLATRYYQFILSQSVCSGIGTSLIITPAMTAVSDVPPLVAATVSPRGQLTEVLFCSRQLTSTIAEHWLVESPLPVPLWVVSSSLSW